MFRALLCPSSGARDYNVDYHICNYSSLTAPKLQPTAKSRVPDDGHSSARNMLSL